MARLTFRRNVLTAVVALLALLDGCGWKPAFSFPSPSGDATIELLQTRVDRTWGTRVDLVTQQGRKTVFENRTEAYVYFVHVNWSLDGTVAGVMVTGFNNWRLAINAQTGEEVSFGQIRDDFAESIRLTYDLPSEVDPIAWAATSAAHTAFLTSHPDYDPVY